jgi:transcriptional regulator with XRE-family HTH domain
MTPTAETIGDRIQRRRKEKGIARGELAKAAGLAYSTLADIENGLQQSSTKLHKIAAHLDVPVMWLETGEGPSAQAVSAAIREAAAAYTSPRSVHGINCSPEGAQIGAEWDKIEGEEYRKLARDFVYGLVSAQKRAGRRPGTSLTTRAKGPKPPARPDRSQ